MKVQTREVMQGRRTAAGEVKSFMKGKDIIWKQVVDVEYGTG